MPALVGNSTSTSSSTPATGPCTFCFFRYALTCLTNYDNFSYCNGTSTKSGQVKNYLLPGSPLRGRLDGLYRDPSRFRDRRILLCLHLHLRGRPSPLAFFFFLLPIPSAPAPSRMASSASEMISRATTFQAGRSPCAPGPYFLHPQVSGNDGIDEELYNRKG